MSDTFFTSDTHFGHEKIIQHCNRPFASVAEMDEQMIQRWNTVVKPRDCVYHLGDFAIRYKREQLEKLFKSLNGYKWLITGNHDDKETLKLPWEGVKVYQKLRFDKQKFILFHYPIEHWDQQREGVPHLHGHLHTHGRVAVTAQNRIDVGVDAWAFAPVSIDEIKAITRLAA